MCSFRCRPGCCCCSLPEHHTPAAAACPGQACTLLPRRVLPCTALQECPEILRDLTLGPMLGRCVIYLCSACLPVCLPVCLSVWLSVCVAPPHCHISTGEPVGWRVVHRGWRTCLPALRPPAQPPDPPACRGAYGRVYRGSWHSASVAVKVGGWLPVGATALLHAALCSPALVAAPATAARNLPC